MKIKQFIIKTEEGETDLFYFLQELDRRLTLLEQSVDHLWSEMEEN